uniref:Uncharacterized protein n=1 Tax=Lepeophtheirus salmonis TaxID=72036 RepID=A0A0K2V550_LEPSM
MPGIVASDGNKMYRIGSRKA